MSINKIRGQRGCDCRCVCLARWTWRCWTGTENDGADSASFEFPTGGVTGAVSSWKTLKWWRRRHGFVAARQRRCHGCNVSLWHWLKRCFWSRNDWLRSSWQRNTGGLSYLCANSFGWVESDDCVLDACFDGVASSPGTDPLKLAYHDRVALAVHGEHQASDQVATVLMLWRVEHDPCCILLSLFDVPTTATRGAHQ